MTSNLPPFAMEVDGAPGGALYELVRELLQRAGLPGAIVVVPWARAVHQSANAARTAIFPLSRTEVREHGFRWLVKLYDERYIFLALRGGRFDTAAPERMQERRIVHLRGSSLRDLLLKMGYRNLVEASTVQDCRRFLERGIAEAVFGEHAIVNWSLRHSGDAFAISRPIVTTTSWLASSLDVDEEEGARLQKAMETLVADGTRDRIYRRYGLL